MTLFDTILLRGKMNDQKMKSSEFEEISELIDYSPETGNFTWKIGRRGARKGDVAGRRTDTGYWAIKINYELYSGHRLAFLLMKGRWPAEQIDHINGCGFDNRWENLREVSHNTNMKNLKQAKNNISGVTGVCWSNRENMWKSQIQVEGRNKSLGYYKNLNEAVDARKKAEKIYNFHPNHGKR